MWIETFKKIAGNICREIKFKKTPGHERILTTCGKNGKQEASENNTAIPSLKIHRNLSKNYPFVED